MSSTIEQIKMERSDLSFFLVHLTKSKDETPAYQVLEKILRRDPDGRCRLIGTPQGLFTSSKGFDSELIKAVCFTEAPLDQIKHFAKPIQGESSRNYSEFGLVFNQEFIRKNGGNPCFYINTLQSNELKDAVFALHNIRTGVINDSLNFSQFCDMYSRLFPFFNIFGPTKEDRTGPEVDFYWEREWRVSGDLFFRYEDVFVGLCEDNLVERFSESYGIPFICPAWNYDRILRQLREWQIEVSNGERRVMARTPDVTSFF